MDFSMLILYNYWRFLVIYDWLWNAELNWKDILRSIISHLTDLLRLLGLEDSLCTYWTDHSDQCHRYILWNMVVVHHYWLCNHTPHLHYWLVACWVDNWSVYGWTRQKWVLFHHHWWRENVSFVLVVRHHEAHTLIDGGFAWVFSREYSPWRVFLWFHSINIFGLQCFSKVFHHSCRVFSVIQIKETNDYLQEFLHRPPRFELSQLWTWCKLCHL